MGANTKNAAKLSPDKCMMPLSYDLEIFPEYLVPKRKLIAPNIGLVVAVYHCTKIHQLSSRSKLSG